MEELTLTAPQTVATYRVDRLNLDWPGARIKVVVTEPNGKKLYLSYEGSIATTLMTQLNKANLSTQSLQSRILQRLAADGKLPSGTVTGTPD